MSFYKWLHRREHGICSRYGDDDFIMRRLFSSLEPYKNWDEAIFKFPKVADHGAVFNLEFSPEGNVLLAACEKKSVLLYDPISTKTINKFDAHADSVNFIRFIDNNMFATCSDDTTIALWDLRHMGHKLRCLRGHTNWVKNVEYSTKDKLLVSSGFDGTIFTWDITAQTEEGFIYQKVFHTSGLMRSRLTPDSNKLVISTTGGYLMIIHDLDLGNLLADLGGFRPSIFRLMQLGRQYIPQAAKYSYVFSKKNRRNRIELVTDFPKDNDAEIIKSLQIHPKGHSFLSRNISYNTVAEWLCVHSIVEESKDYDSSFVISHRKRARMGTVLYDESLDPLLDEPIEISNRANRAEEQRNRDEDSGPPRTRSQSRPRQRGSFANELMAARTAAEARGVQVDPFIPDIWAAEVTLEERLVRQNRARNSNSVHGYNLVYAISSGVIPTPPSESTNSGDANSADETDGTPNSSNSIGSSVSSTGSSSSGSRNNSTSSSSSSSLRNALQASRVAASNFLRMKRRYGQNKDRSLFFNPKKLMYYIEDSPAGKGLIKEPCFSTDGRIIASPFENGARILAFDDRCGEYPAYEVDQSRKPRPKELQVLKTISIGPKKDNLLSCKFSPREPLLVGAFQSGKIAWYHPNF